MVQPGQDSDNGLIEKWPSRNLGGIRSIRRSRDDAVFFSESDTKPSCAKSKAAHCIQDGDCGRMRPSPAIQSESANARKTEAAACSDLMSSISACHQFHLPAKLVFHSFPRLGSIKSVSFYIYLSMLSATKIYNVFHQTREDACSNMNVP